MTKQNEQEALGTAMNKTEMFFEKNSKSMIIALLALFVPPQPSSAIDS